MRGVGDDHRRSRHGGGHPFLRSFLTQSTNARLDDGIAFRLLEFVPQLLLGHPHLLQKAEPLVGIIDDRQNRHHRHHRTGEAHQQARRAIERSARAKMPARFPCRRARESAAPSSARRTAASFSSPFANSTSAWLDTRRCQPFSGEILPNSGWTRLGAQISPDCARAEPSPSAASSSRMGASSHPTSRTSVRKAGLAFGYADGRCAPGLR